MVDAVYWIWLQQALGAGSVKVDRALELLGNPAYLYEMTRDELKRTELFAPKEIDKIKATSLDGAQENITMAAKTGCNVVTPDHPDFPKKLAEISCIPCVLYTLGDISGLDEELLLTMVGTRRGTEQGVEMAKDLSFRLAKAGCVVVSGLAVGIDYACHQGALDAGGRTIGLLACGMNVDYPAASNHLKRKIINSGGALITEYPFGQRTDRYQFHIRNRLMSGISDGVVVVQAPQSSGALITARHATEQGREVFALPGSVQDVSMQGCNQLIADGAKMVLHIGSILEEYYQKYAYILRENELAALMAPQGLGASADGTDEIPRKKTVKVIQPREKKAASKLDEASLSALGISENAVRVYRLLDESMQSFDVIANKTGLSTFDIMCAMTDLELAQIVQQHPGRLFSIQEPDSDKSA